MFIPKYRHSLPRCSLLEGDELPEDANTTELPLPDIVASEEEVREVPPPPILIEEAEEVDSGGDLWLTMIQGCVTQGHM